MNQASLMPFGNGMVARTMPGGGDKVLWIHGYTMDSSTWHDVWQQLPGWHHIGIDLPGHGASAPLTDYRTVVDMARSIGVLAIEQGIQHIVGLSFGGMVAVQIAIEYPHTFASFTLGSPSLIGGPGEPYTRRLYRNLGILYAERGPGPWMTELWMQWPPDIFKGAAAHPALRQQLADVINKHTWQELHGATMGRLIGATPPQTVAMLQDITTTTLILIGDAEMPAFKLTAAIIQSAIPNSECITVPGAGHLCILEAPTITGPRIDAHLRSHRTVTNSI